MTDQALAFLDVVRMRGVLFEKRKMLLRATGAPGGGITEYGDDETSRVVSIIGEHWLKTGLPCIHLGHKLAASMLFSDVHSSPELRMPWPAFAIYVPPGILAGPLALVVAKDEALASSGDLLWMASADHTGAIQWVPPVTSLQDLAERAETLGGETSRWAQLASRLVALACAELAVYRPSSAPPAANRTVKRDKRSGEPCLWSFQLTRPVDLDLREHVRAWAAGPHAGDTRKLTVQSVVRGHYKTQAHGPRNELRKWIYIQPHRRGDPDAPTALKPHLVGTEPVGSKR